MKSPALVKVLLPHRLLGNIYVQELGRAYRELGCEVVYGPENLFESTYRPDILHLNWPEDLYRSFGTGSIEMRTGRLFAILDDFKNEGGQIAWTVHNEKPHESTDREVDSRIYQGIVDRANVIHHHCECSRDKLISRYRVPSDTGHFVAPHGHYFSYRNDVTREDARRELGLSPDGFVYLHFGAIRGYKGIDQVLDTFRKVRRKGDALLVAGRLYGNGDLAERLKFACYKYFDSSLQFHLRRIDSEDIQIFLNASDAVVLGHTDGLNSGVAILGMSFGKPVIGPRLGCIQSVLDQGANLTYATGDVIELAERMVEVRNLVSDRSAAQNKAAAASWEWSNIARPVIERFTFCPA